MFALLLTFFLCLNPHCHNVHHKHRHTRKDYHRHQQKAIRVRERKLHQYDPLTLPAYKRIGPL